MFKYKKTLIVLGLVAVAVGYLVYRGSREPQAEYVTALVEKGTLTQTVSATGDLLDDSEIVLNFELGGRIEKVLVKKGDKVATGDVLALLENKNLSGQLAQAKAALDKAVAEAGLNNDSIRESKVSVENADEYLEKTKKLENQKVDAAETALSNAEEYYDDAKDFYDDAPSKTNKLTLTTAENSKKAAEESLDTTRKNRDLAIVSAENSLSAAEAKLETTESSLMLSSKNATVASARAGYEMALNNLSKASLRAPVSGTIVEVNNKVGEILGTGVIKESFARLIADDFVIEANIPESDIVKLETGQRVDVSFDALPSTEEFEGELVEIDPAETVIQDVVYYGVKIRLSQIDRRLRPGMSANLDIHTNEKSAILMIPIRAIVLENGEKFVDVLKEENVVERKKITTGLDGDDGMIEVKSGLAEAEQVITFKKEEK